MTHFHFKQDIGAQDWRFWSWGSKSWLHVLVAARPGLTVGLQHWYLNIFFNISLKYNLQLIVFSKGFSGDSDGKESACNAGDGFDPWVRKIPWRREWLPTPVFLPGKSHRQRSLGGYRESDTTTTDHLTLFKLLVLILLFLSYIQRPTAASVFLWLFHDPRSAQQVTAFGECFSVLRLPTTPWSGRVPPKALWHPIVMPGDVSAHHQLLLCRVLMACW